MKETITYKGKKITKNTTTKGQVTYSMKGVYIGTDVKTGKRVTATITAKTPSQLERKILQSKIEFEENGSTVKEILKVSTFEELAEAWFSSYKTWVNSENTINRVRGYLDNYIIPQFGDYKIDQIESSDIQIWVNRMAKRAKKSVESGVLRAKKGNAKDFGAVAHKVKDIFNYGITNAGLTMNPASSIKIPPKPKAPKKRVMVLHDEELSTWIKYLDSLSNSRADRRFKIICQTLLSSALRINELLALTIDDLDFETNEIIVSKTIMWKGANKKYNLKGQVICKPTPKTDAGNRRVAVPADILLSLKEFYEE